MKKNIYFTLLLALSFIFLMTDVKSQNQKNFNSTARYKIDFSGKWMFAVDSLDEGIAQRWFSKKLDGEIKLPGSMATNGKGNDITVNTPWTGQIVDSSWFINPEYARYRVPGNIKVPFWLQPVKYYKGAAWYQKTVTIPTSWKGKYIELFIERSHWETTVWVDSREIGMQNSLATPHVFDLTNALAPGTHQLTIRVDNRVKAINVGQNSHSISDHTQTNWNGMIGQLYIAARPALYIGDVQLYPDVKQQQVVAQVTIHNISGHLGKAAVQVSATSNNASAEKLPVVTRAVLVKGDSLVLEIIYPMGKQPLLWDEFHPNLYALKISLTANGNKDEKVTGFGMRNFSTRGTQFTINGRLTFLRGTLECAIFPKTGYPPADTAAWLRIFKICRSYGLNHVRFHSWCPPEAAFEAADRLGFYLHIECSSWANQGATIGEGNPLDQYIYNESQYIVKAYGNHPSFCMMAYGNEPAGKNMDKYLTAFVGYWKKKDPRLLYTTAAGWPVIPGNDYNSTSDPRIQAWGMGLKSIINSHSPQTDFDWAGIIAKWPQPTVSHEIGQWCVYPDFKEITKYTGVLKARNFEIFRETLDRHGMLSLADSFLLASGKLQAMCYKADIEAALRTPGFGGFQLLDLHDFPGQGTALVGVLNAFWEDKGYINAKTYSRFCNSVVPLARLKKMVYQNNEDIIAQVQIANFGEAILNESIRWNIKNAAGQILWKGDFIKSTIPLGNAFMAGQVKQPLHSIKEAGQFTLTVAVGKFENSWDFFVYPAMQKEATADILVTQQLDERALQVLNRGGKVLLTLKKGSLKADKGGAVQIGYSSIFWNTAWTDKQPPLTMGVLCNPGHPALAKFPTQYHSNYQWYDAMSHSTPIMLDSVVKGIQPIVRVIDDWVTARPLGLLFECKTGRGRLLVSGIDLLSDKEKRPEAKQLLYSLVKYMSGDKFNPADEVTTGQIRNLLIPVD